MREKAPLYYLPWQWWAQSGERLSLGLELSQVFQAPGNQLKSAAQKGLESIRREIDKGVPVVESIRRSGLSLPLDAWCLLEAGEQTGRLGDAMREVGLLLKASGRRKSEFVSQLWYPALVLLTSLLVMAIILFWVVPQLRAISESMGQGSELPWLTEHIDDLYAGLLALSVGSLAGLASVGRLLLHMGRRSRRWASLREKLRCFIPCWGSLASRQREARILRQLGTLLQGGLTLPSSLQMIADQSPDLWEKESILEFKRHLLSGSSFAESISAFALVGEVGASLLSAGHESGRLEVFMLRLADDLDWEVILELKRWVRLLEPLTIGALSLLVGGLVLAYLLPMVHMLERLA